MQNLNLPPPTQLRNPNPFSDQHRLIAFTTPENYATRLSTIIHQKGWTPLWCPTVIIEPTPEPIKHFLSFQSKTPLDQFSAIAFTSRTGISSFSQALSQTQSHPLSPNGDTFIISALGKDSELLDSSFISKLCENPDRVRILIPPVASPRMMVESLREGTGRKILCPVPSVIGLEEPPVVPEFLKDLAEKGWVVVRVNAYETRWAGPHCAEDVVKWGDENRLDAIVFTSSGEVEGFLKGLKEMGLDWGRLRRRWRRLVVAAHGPVTAAGAERLGVGVDVVSTRFDSFDGVVDALASKWLM
ncbi:hypothetical protein DCAR_0206029 [Daucus carota subsp. sativus]|uniref:Tetrapyrrole biosynthesis uroporphyrinogen III synthase domain-containing protein n=1 Tax=Daucus carota subsp. sativus TaxID=79200 RepID=A0A166CZU1_DAUCS|nr:PREDICTED: uncharacterized protein LOC108209288 isoform X1 [Daucus carota subsp. sativus]WOG86811.1 hypothetical protein DCAR_0206029 [Daucus carota subsp. sativus]